MTIGRVHVVFAGFGGAPGMATHYFRLGGQWNWNGYKQECLDDVKGAYDNLQSLWPTTFTYTVLSEIDLINEETGQIEQTLTGQQLAGAGTTDAGLGPLAAGLCVTWRTEGVVNGKHVRGRTFIVPVVVGAAGGDGTPTSAALAAADAYAVDLEGAFSPWGNPVIWSRPTASRAGTAWDIYMHTLSDKFAVLRSRRD